MDGDDEAVECATPWIDVPIGDGFFAFVPGVGIATAVAGDMFPRSAHRGRAVSVVMQLPTRRSSI